MTIIYYNDSLLFLDGFWVGRKLTSYINKIVILTLLDALRSDDINPNYFLPQEPQPKASDKGMELLAISGGKKQSDANAYKYHGHERAVR